MRPLGAAHNVTVKTQVPPPGVKGARSEMLVHVWGKVERAL